MSLLLGTASTSALIDSSVLKVLACCTLCSSSSYGSLLSFVESATMMPAAYLNAVLVLVKVVAHVGDGTHQLTFQFCHHGTDLGLRVSRLSCGNNGIKSIATPTTLTIVIA